MRKYNEVVIAKKYKVLRGISITLYVLGLIIIGLGLLCFLFSLFAGSAVRDDSMSSGMAMFPLGQMMGVMRIVGLVMSFLFGISLIAYAQFINLFLDVEANQREMIEFQKQIINGLPDNNNPLPDPSVTAGV